MPTLPVELIDIIFDLHLESTAFHCEHVAKLCRVDKRVYRRAIPYLYRAPDLHRNNVKAFLQAIGTTVADQRGASALLISSRHELLGRIISYSLASLVQSIAFISFEQVTPSKDAKHEHVDNDDIFECLELVSPTLQNLSIDMACSHAACGWYTDGIVRGTAVHSLHLPRLETLTCRCPKGYLPLKTRKLIELLKIGHAPKLKTLNLVWTAPGPFDSPGHIANLSQTLELCPNVDLLRVVDTQPTTMSRAPYAALRTIFLPPELRWPIGLPHTWRDTTHEDVLPPYDDMFQQSMCIVQANGTQPVWLELAQEQQGLSRTVVEMKTAMRELFNEARTCPSDDLSRITVRDHIYSIARALERLGAGVATAIAAAAPATPQQRRTIDLQRSTIFTPRTRRHNARPWIETSRQIGQDAGWRAFVALQHTTRLPRSDERNEDGQAEA